MADYKKMYLTLVDEVSSTIERLKIALEKAEDIYVNTDKTESEEITPEQKNTVFRDSL